MTLSTKVLLGLALGIVAGLGFGDWMSVLGIFGRAFVLLLQMTVLPYVVVSLLAAVGGLTPREAGNLVRHAGQFLLACWGATLLVVVALPLAFPAWESASFFSPTLVAPKQEPDFLSLYIPANPFQAAAEGVVPAMVVFCVAVGLALMRVDRKGPLLESLRALEDALLDLSGRVVNLAPYGVFAVTAEAAGTMGAAEFEGLQVYGVTYAVAALVLGLWVLPMLLVRVTPLGYREVLGSTRDALVTAFATGNVFIVLPILAGRSKELLAARTEDTKGTGRMVDVVVPVSFTLSSAGKLLSLSFVLFASWVSGFPVSYAQYPSFIFTGVFSFFASTFTAIPFLLDLYRIPSETFQLFVIADNVVGNRFGALLAAVHILVMALGTGAAAAGLVKVNGRDLLLRWALPSVVITAVALAGVRLGFEAIERPYQGYREIVDRPLLLPTARLTKVTEAPPMSPAEGAEAPPRPALERIRARGTLRVGYERDRLPFVFRNESGELVGFDVEMMHALARDLGVGLEFVTLGADRAVAELDRGGVDVVIGGWAVTPERLLQARFTASYLDTTLAFIVPDHRREEFNTREGVQSLKSLRLGVVAGAYYEATVRDYLPQAEIVTLDSARPFFTGAVEGLDGLVYSAEAGSAWTLIYPQYSVAVPHPDVLAAPIAYVVARNAADFADFLDAWIDLKKKDSTTVDQLFAYWFEGKEPRERRKRRWSVVRDVLGWGADAANVP